MHLWPSPYSARFKRELADHLEDANGENRLGDPKMLAEFFHQKTGARRKILLGLFVCLFVFWCVFWTVQFLGLDETPMESQIMQTWTGKILGPFAGVGLLLMLPLIPLNPLLVPVWGSFDLIPYSTSFIYTLLYTVFTFPPPVWKWKPRPPTSI